MFLNVIDPVGRLTSMDLGALEIWRLELVAFPSSKIEHPERKNMLGLAFVYVLHGQYATVTVAAFDTETEHEAEQVAAVGLPAMTREGNIDRVREAMKVVINAEGQTQASTTALVQQATRLVNLYHDLLAALFGRGAAALGSLEVPLVGQFEDEKKVYRYALTMHRNQPWLPNGAVVDPGLGMGAPPGVAGAKPPPVSKGGKHPVGRKAPGGAIGPPSASAEPPELNAESLPPLG
jgi:hypothetical protein